MAYTGTIASEADINLMAGENVDTTGNTEANRNLLMYQAEAYLSTLVSYDIVTNWSTLNAIYKKILTEWASRYCACSLIMYNTNGYLDLIQAEDMVQVHIYRMEQIEKLLLNVNTKNFLGFR